MNTERLTSLRDRALNLLESECTSPQGWFLASGSQNSKQGEGNFNCLFGRDSAWMSIFMCRLAELTGNKLLLEPVKRTLIKLADTQGRQYNPESGEYPGRIVHEVRTKLHEHLTKREAKPWHVYPDGIMRIYMSADSTFLFLLAAAEYLETSGDTALIQDLEQNLRSAAQYALRYGDKDGDGLQDYSFEAVHHGGLRNQGWMDSDTVKDGKIHYPVALVETQSYAYQAYLYWARYFRKRDNNFSELLEKQASGLKEKFSERFQKENSDGIYLSPSIDGLGNFSPLVRSNMGHCLYAPSTKKKAKLIIDSSTAQKIADRLLKPDMFDPNAGIRTLSDKSELFSDTSYHEGAIWPHDTMIFVLGLLGMGSEEQAERVMQSILKAAIYFKTPGMELYHHNEQTGFSEFHHPITGAIANHVQGWALTATALAAELQLH